MLPRSFPMLPRVASCARATALVAGVLALLPAGTASAAAPACLTRTEATGLVGYALPQVIRGSGKRCQSTLPSGAFLTVKANAMAQRYETQKAGYWPQAKQAFLKVGSAKDPAMAQIFRSMPDESLQKLVDAAVEGIVVQAIPLDKCLTIDSAASLLSPLPPENMAGVIALLMDIGGKAASADPVRATGRITICKD